MPTIPSLTTPTGTFDLTFDATFQGVLITPTTPSVPGECRTPGAFLTWQSPTGWPYWLFDGPMSTDKTVSSRGDARQAGLTLATQKESAYVITARTSGLTAEQAEAVATIYDSVAVYLLAPDKDGVFHQVPVTIDPGTFPVHTSRSATHTLSVTFTLPARRSQRR
ncbi:hypothetical protein [Spirosoma sp. KUDC1026]|uniref:hypothetical protein n=1 Tax=Spirosoma sp. KUDC1026 TaxID=2745947 RepID=UPI00159BB44B|nr:hypothetical protein [Spirosoma sp. KUDC1026]QKZ15207.1 hypothetical protein HU175_22300 [Spirosoma sp. KUDC1026]